MHRPIIVQAMLGCIHVDVNKEHSASLSAELYSILCSRFTCSFCATTFLAGTKINPTSSPFYIFKGLKVCFFKRYISPIFRYSCCMTVSEYHFNTRNNPFDGTWSTRTPKLLQQNNIRPTCLTPSGNFHSIFLSTSGII